MILKEVKDIEHKNPKAFKKNNLPLVRIKRIMKEDTDVKFVSNEAPILFSKACELFIIDFAHRAWIHTINDGRKTMQVSIII